MNRGITSTSMVRLIDSLNIGRTSMICSHWSLKPYWLGVGYCKLEGVLQGKELAECQAAALDYIEHSERGDVPEGFKQTPGGKYLHAHAWASCLENLAMHPRVWPTILELLDGKPQLTAESGTLFWEDYSRRAHLSDNYDPLRNMRVSVAGSDGVHLHCGREGLFAHGMEFDELHCGYFRELHGRLHCGNFVRAFV